MTKRHGQTRTGLLCTFFLLPAFAMASAAQAPVFEKIDPPSWWAGSTINPVRVLIRGRNLAGARIESSVPGITASNFAASSNGHYLFADISLSEIVRPGNHQLRIVTPSGISAAPFEVFTQQPRLGNYNGFLPDDVIYFVVTDRFSDGDPANNDPPKSKGLYDRKRPRYYHGGDLQGIINRLPYIKSLGATAIATTPIYDNSDRSETIPEIGEAAGYHGYHPIDLYGTDEHLGNLAKLKEFVRLAHQAGLIVIQDQVLNHTGPNHPWASDPPTPNWFNGTAEKHSAYNRQDWAAMNPRATHQTQRRSIDGWMHDALPDLNQNNPEVERYLIQHSLWWIAQAGFDAVRIGSPANVPRSFWSKWGAAVHREFPKVTILGEIANGDPALLSYFQKGRRGHDGLDPEIDSLMDRVLFDEIRDAFGSGNPIRGVSKAFARDWLYPKPSALVTAIGVHEIQRFMNESGATGAGLKLAQTLIMTSRGTPMLYYGDEAAMTGGADPDNRSDFPGGFPGDTRNAFTTAGRTPEENDVWDHLAKLGAIRREQEPLRRGRTLDLLDEVQQFAYARLTDKAAVIVVFNNDTKPAEVSFEISFISRQIATDAVLTDALGRLPDVRVNDGVVRAAVPARSAGIYIVK